MLSKEEIENYELFKNRYLQQPISLLTKENLDKLAEHCKKTVQFEKGIEHSIILELLYRYDQLESNHQKLIEKLEERRKKNNNRYGQAIDDDEFPEMYEYRGVVTEDDYILKILKGEKE